MRNFKMLQLGQCLPFVPGIVGASSYAPSPVWRDSTTAEVRFMPLRRKQATRLYHQARAFERQTREPGHQDGALGRNGLAVLHALVFDFLNYASGRLDPSYEAIARMACLSVRSVARGLKQLKAMGVLNWVRRASARVDESGAFLLEQETNAYAILPVSQWRGFTPRPEAPPPEPGTWGDHPCGARDALTEAVAEIAHAGGGERDRVAGVVRQLEADPGNGLAAVLARLGRAIRDAESPGFSESASLAKNHSQESVQ